MKITVKRSGQISGQLIGQISKQAAAWHIPIKMVADWLKQRGASQLADLNQTQGIELLSALEQMKVQHDAEPATNAEKASLLSYCQSMYIDFGDIYTYAPEYVTTRADIRRMRELVRETAQKRSRNRRYGNAGEQQYYENNPVRMT